MIIQTMKQICLFRFEKETLLRRRKNNYYKSPFHKNHLIICFLIIYLSLIIFKDKNLREKTPEIVEGDDEFVFE